MKIIMFIIIFLLIGAFFIVSQNNLALIKEGNTTRFISLYKVWLITTIRNVGSLTGHVVKMEWLPR